MKILGNLRARALYALAGLMAIGSIFTACKDNDDAYQSPELSIKGLTDETQQELSYPVDGGTASFSVSTNRKWTATSTASWLDVSPKEGASGTHTITVKTLPNTGAARQTQILLKAGIKSQAITVKQAGSSNPEPTPFEGMPLATFLEKYDKGVDIAKIEEDLFFEAVVLSDVAQGNQPFGKLIVVQAGEVGITVILKDEIRDLKPGEVVRIKAKGAKLAYFGGVTLQLNLPEATSIERKGEVREISPKPLSIAQIYEGKYDNILVQVSGVQFVNAEGTLLKGGKTTNHAITDCQPTPEGKNKVSVTVFKPAKFGSEAIPAKRGSITGILQLTRDKNNKDQIRFYNLVIRSMADLQLTEDRCQEGDTPSPTPGDAVQTTLPDFLKKYDKGADIAKIEENAYFEATVLSDVAQGNQPLGKLIVVQAGEVGLSVILKKDVHDLKAGEVVRIKVKDAKLAYFNGVSLQLNLAAEASLERTGTTKPITPKALTIAQVYEGKYDNILVKISGVQFVETEGTLLKGGKTTHHAITDCQPTPEGKNKVSVTVFKPAKFGSEAIPAKRGSITGILQLTRDKNHKDQIRFYNLAIRSMADFQLTEDRCQEGGGIPEPPAPEPKPEEEKMMTLADFIKAYDGAGEKKVEDNVAFSATLLNDIEANNLQSLLNLVLQDGSQGITLRLPKQSKPAFARDAVLKVKAKGATVKRYNGSLQVDFTEVADALTDDKIKATGETKLVAPTTLSIAELKQHKAENILVRIEKTQLKEYKGAFNTSNKSSVYLLLETDPSLDDKTTLALGVSGYAPFKGDTRPEGSGSVIGILVKNINKSGVCQYTVWPRTKADLVLTGTRFGGEPTPPTPQPTLGDLMIITYVEGSQNNKYIQIYNPTDRPINLGERNYTLRLDQYTKSKKGSEIKHSGIKELPLTGEIPAGGVMVFAHDKAMAYSGTVAVRDTKVINFNGDDNIALFKGDELIDAIGTWGSAWIKTDNTDAGKDLTLHRKPGVKKPNKTYTPDEWEMHEVDHVATLGKR